MSTSNYETPKISTGITGLDEILLGGFSPSYCYMLRGGPGTGKTTFGLHFLLEGARAGENVLFISFEEQEDNIRTTANKLGFDASSLPFLDLSPNSDFFAEAQSYDIFTSSEVEREPITQSIVDTILRIKPARVFLDSLTQLRYLSSDRFQFHRQVLSFIRFLSENGITVLVSSETSPDVPDYDLQFLTHAVIHLENNIDIRTISVIKYRNSDFLHGHHSYRLTDKGAIVYPRLNPTKLSRDYKWGVLSSGINSLDKLLGGGIEEGTISMISGPAGVGKTTLGIQIANSCVSQGHKAAVFSFEEEVQMIVDRCQAIGIDIKENIDQGMLCIEKIEPMFYSADHFALLVRDIVQKQNIKVALFDSTSGYSIAMKNQKLADHLHLLCKYLTNIGVTVLLITELSNITGDFLITENGISYLSDNVIFIRYLEIKGELKKAIGVLKKRLSDFEKTLREFEISKNGIQIGHPLINLRGILHGNPDWIT